MVQYSCACVGRGGGAVGGAEKVVSLVCGGGRGGGWVGAPGSVRPGAVSSFTFLPGPQAREGAFHCSPFRAAYSQNTTQHHDVIPSRELTTK